MSSTRSGNNIGSALLLTAGLLFTGGSFLAACNAAAENGNLNDGFFSAEFGMVALLCYFASATFYRPSPSQTFFPSARSNTPTSVNNDNQVQSGKTWGLH
jgi:hypothetical protein